MDKHVIRRRLSKLRGQGPADAGRVRGNCGLKLGSRTEMPCLVLQESTQVE